MLIGVLFFAKGTHRMQLLGLVIALAGALMLVFTQGGVAMPVINYYALFIILATICYGVNINIDVYKRQISLYRIEDTMSVTPITPVMVRCCRLLRLFRRDLIGKQGFGGFNILTRHHHICVA